MVHGMILMLRRSHSHIRLHSQERGLLLIKPLTFKELECVWPVRLWYAHVCASFTQPLVRTLPRKHPKVNRMLYKYYTYTYASTTNEKFTMFS